MILAPIIFVLALWPPPSASPCDLPVGRELHWVFTKEHYKEGAIHPTEGGRPLEVDQPEWIGEGEHQSMLLPDKPMTYKVDSRELPKRKLSIEAWVAPKSEREFAAIVCVAEDNESDEAGFYLCQRKGRFSFFLENKETVNSGNSDEDFLYSAPIKFGEWHHVVATFDTKTMKLYVDGALAASRDTKREVIRQGKNFYVGRSPDLGTYGGFFKGMIGEVRVYEHALSAADVIGNYRASRGRFAE